MFLISKLAWALIKPLNLVMICLAAGAAFSAFGRGRLRKIGKWLTGIAFAIWFVAGVLPVGSIALGALEARFAAPAQLPARIDGIIVLGGVFDARADTEPNTLAFNASAERVWYGLSLARRYPEARMIYSGGNGLPLTEVAGEAEMAERAYRSVGLTGSRIIYERRARNTRENALLSHGLADPKPGQVWLLVTSARHMPRAVGSFRAIDWEVVPYPVDFVTGGVADPIVDFSPFGGLGLLGLAAHEYAGLAYYYLRGWIDEPFPAET